MSTRIAWLVENGKPQGSGLKFMSFHPETGLFEWTEDVHAALHMSRRKDAELLAQESEDAWRIVEHGFDDPQPDTEHRDNAVCPWCGWEHKDMSEWEIPRRGAEGDCDGCHKPFHVTRHITYSTRKVEPK